MRKVGIGLGITLALLAGCGGTQEQTTTSSDSNVDPRMRRIMEFEEEIAAKKEEMHFEGAECATLCRESGHICSQSENICLMADDMREPDSRGRCDRSKATCTEEKTFVQSRCGGCERVDTPGYAGPMD